MDIDEQYELITRNLEEVINEEELKEILRRDGKLKIYWGTATTGKPHVGYFVPIFKIGDFLRAGCEVTILLADLHAYLDNMKSDWDLLEKRTAYYEMIITMMLNIAGVDISQLRFVRGSDFQLSKEYTLDMYKMSALLTTTQTSKAGAEVVKQTENPLMSSLLYPILQALDEQYLDVNVQFGGVDQRKIFMFARTHLPRIGYKARSYLMNPLVPGLGKPEEGKAAKMSSSLPLSKIDFDDSDKDIRNKLNKAYSIDGVVENNGVLALCRYVLFRICESQNRGFVVKRKEEHGGDIEFANYEELEAAFVSGAVVSGDIKKNLADEMCAVISILREAITVNHKTLYEQAYPVEKKEPQRQTVRQADFSILDIVVGKVLEVEVHPDADSLYVEKIDCGEDEPRTVVSGLRNFYQKEELLGRNLLVIKNLPPKNTRGVVSHGMVYCSSNSDHTQVEILPVPEGSEPGDKVFVEGFSGEPEDKVSSKRYTRVASKLTTNAEGIPTYDGLVFQTDKGIFPPSIHLNAKIA